MSSIEQRKFARLETDLECTMVTEGEDFPARVANLSRSGAGLIAPTGKLEVGATVLLLLERAAGSHSLSLPSEVVRVMPRAGDSVYGVQFQLVPPEVADGLQELLKVLVREKGHGRRESPRLSVRANVKCKSRQSFIAQLNDLSCGGLSVRSMTNLEVGSTLNVQLGVDSHPSLMNVTGKVLRSSPADGAWMVSVQFDPPTAEDRAQVLLLLDVLLGLGAAPRPAFEG